MDWFNTNFYRDWGYNLVYPQIFPHHKRGSEDHTKATVEWGAEKSRAALQLLNDAVLGANPYVCGAELTLADLLGGQFVALGDVVRADFAKYPSVKRWLDSLRALPAWKETNAIADGFTASLAGTPFVSV
jgi:glutathione S-transferase